MVDRASIKISHEVWNLLEEMKATIRRETGKKPTVDQILKTALVSVDSFRSKMASCPSCGAELVAGVEKNGGMSLNEASPRDIDSIVALRSMLQSSSHPNALVLLKALSVLESGKEGHVSVLQDGVQTLYDLIELTKRHAAKKRRSRPGPPG